MKGFRNPPVPDRLDEIEKSFVKLAQDFSIVTSYFQQEIKKIKAEAENSNLTHEACTQVLIEIIAEAVPWVDRKTAILLIGQKKEKLEDDIVGCAAAKSICTTLAWIYWRYVVPVPNEVVTQEVLDDLAEYDMAKHKRAGSAILID